LEFLGRLLLRSVAPLVHDASVLSTGPDLTSGSGNAPLGHLRSGGPCRSPGRSVAEPPGAASWSRSDEIGRLGGTGRLGRRTAASTRVRDHDASVHVRVHVALEIV